MRNHSAQQVARTGLMNPLLCVNDDAIWDEFDWNESESLYEGETMACDVLAFISECGTD